VFLSSLVKLSFNKITSIIIRIVLNALVRDLWPTLYYWAPTWKKFISWKKSIAVIFHSTLFRLKIFIYSKRFYLMKETVSRLIGSTFVPIQLNNKKNRVEFYKIMTIKSRYWALYTYLYFLMMLFSKINIKSITMWWRIHYYPNRFVK